MQLFVQTNGVPTGPPSPQQSNKATFTPNRHTLLMNPGDVITVHMFDAKIPGGHALEAEESDLTTGKSGFMIASAANGFMNTNVNTCNGTPFNYQPEYSSAAAQNVIPWGFGPYMINSQYEIGHFEPCTSLSGKVTSTGDAYFTNCSGPYDTTAENTNLEPDDAPCYPFGERGGWRCAPSTWPAPKSRRQGLFAEDGSGEQMLAGGAALPGDPVATAIESLAAFGGAGAVSYPGEAPGVS